MNDDAGLSRRELLRGRLFPRRPAAAAAAPALPSASTHGAPGAPPALPAGARRLTLPIHRPPGAVDEASFLAGCTRCGECLKACPEGAIIPAPERFRHAAGTPMIDVHARACVMCHDTPCIPVCAPGVLSSRQPLKMGVAWIQPEACLAHAGSFCTVCAERCPVPGAITLAAGKPTIHPDACTGCGVCHGVCPAPANAIVMMPLADRPGPAAA